MTRVQEREEAFRAVYALSFGDGGDVSHLVADSFSKTLYEATVANLGEIDEKIKAAIKHDFEKIYKVDLALLRLGIAEMVFVAETPKPIVISSIMDMAKKYSTEGSAKFLNGVLGSV